MRWEDCLDGLQFYGDESGDVGYVQKLENKFRAVLFIRQRISPDIIDIKEFEDEASAISYVENNWKASAISYVKIIGKNE